MCAGRVVRKHQATLYRARSCRALQTVLKTRDAVPVSQMTPTLSDLKHFYYAPGFCWPGIN